jgi:long-chain acyl-CoA synthetase
MDLHAAAPAAAARPPALDAPTLCRAFQITAAEHPEAIALRNPGDAVAITWRDYAERVERIAAGLAALGVQRGDTVGLMLLNRPEFHLLDTAILHLGAVPFSVYNTCTYEQIAHQFRNAANRVVVTEAHFLSSVAAARRLAPGIERVVQIDGADEDVMRHRARARSASRRPGRRSRRRTSRRSSTPPAPRGRRRASSSPTPTRSRSASRAPSATR